MFAKTFGCCRKVYNLMLTDKIAYYKATGKSIQTTPAQYKDEYPYLREVDSLALANVQLNLQAAYRNFFDKKRKVRSGFPKFKSAKHSRKSYTTNYKKGAVAILDKRYIKLPKVGKVKAVIHRVPNDAWVGTNHKFYRESHDKLAKEQRRLSRMKGSKKNEPKSNNYIKQLRKTNKIHRHIANQRNDNLHKISTEIANQYDVVCVENLNMAAIGNKGFKNGKATMDNGYGMFLNMLEYKLSDRGKYFVKVDKFYPSSQLCSCCGSRKKLELSERKYICTCGLEIDRDLNAAINIKNEGLRLLA